MCLHLRDNYKQITMPFKSKKQRSWMFINMPELAKKWERKYGGKVRTTKKKNKKVKKRPY